ncbi:3-hydroxyacyl-CoA dehydrogenase family protein [Sporosarcina sp. resist]|uniref:3-hydroxyacyl-CoA dehydrogenase family protein n=1 Tax=Sporosarcina sp. resist TaxID=2762563 RepID=UPI00164D450D|nr:3-hydroxyacyl-CoA dehydrogenase family protein [Sporosarcina sp. resist]QNK86209.1 3-hydroxyacyl-CoA dehydrogenase family protein [Sporosarcina sp. resist]
MIKQVGILGAGTMGFGIAFQFALNGRKTMLCDLSEEALDIAKGKFGIYLKIFREEGYNIPISDEEVMSNITFTTKLNDLADRDFIIESISENLALKQRIFQELDVICGEQTILASNTSSLRLSEITVNVEKHKDRVMLTHFFNPAHIVPLVELLRTEETDDKVFNEVKDFLEVNNKVTIEVKKEVAGLVANRIQIALAREALSLVEDGVVSEKDLDTAIFAGPGFRFSSSGLMKIMDFGGLDIWNITIRELQSKIESSDRSYKIIDDRIEAGAFGVKSGQGFYNYPGKGLDGYVIERDTDLIKHLLSTYPSLKMQKEEANK